MNRKSVLLLLLFLLCGLLLCGCGTVTTEDAQSYLDGSGDVSRAEEETAQEAETGEGTTEVIPESENSSAVMDDSQTASANSENEKKPSQGQTAKNNSSSENNSNSSSSGKSNNTSANGSGSSSGTNSSASAKQCTVSIDCKTILNNMSLLNASKSSLVPADGVILKTVTVTFRDGDSVFDVLKAVTRDKGIHMDFNESPAYGGAYVKGIANLYEKDCGDLSGWEYNVNGWYPNYACSNYIVSNGDVIQWRYTCNVGKDL